MHITRVVVKNYRCLEKADVTLHPELNVIVGNNECGKSTLMEAVHLALTGQLNGRPIQTELHPHLFNAQAVATYRDKLIADQREQPPSILIELYFHDSKELAKFKGTNNTLRLDVPGVSLLIELHPEFAKDFAEYVAKPKEFRALPIEYYVTRWRGFSENDIPSARSIPIKPAMIDASTIRCIAASSRLREFPLEAVAGEHAVDLLTRSYEAVASSTRKAIETAASLGDAGTSDLFTGLSRSLDKSLWFLEAHLQ
jgi:putative ATP-dependent endonuclease of the OLD family